MRLSTQPPEDDETTGRRNVMLLAAGVLAVGLVLLDRLHLSRPNSWQAAVGVSALFLAGELVPVSIEFRRESHTFTFTSVPFALGLFFLSPPLLVLCRLISSVISLGAIRRQPPFQLVTNISTHLIEVVTAASIVQLLDPHLGLGPSSWLALAAAVLGADLVGALVVTAAISAYQHRFEGSLLGGLGYGGLSTIADLTLALVVVTLVALHQPAAWLMLGVGVFIVVLLRALASMTARHSQVERLYELNQELGEAVLAGDVIPLLLSRTMEVLHAESAWIVTSPATGQPTRIRLEGDDAVSDEARPLDRAILERLEIEPAAFLLRARDASGGELLSAGHTEAIVARLPTGGADTMAMVIADRSGSVRPFDIDDVTLFGTLALHAAVALRNVQFVDQLQAESALNEELATHDSLTGLANRAVVERTIDRLLDDRADVGVLLIDLDRFKDVNDTLGHNNGDLLLIEAGRRMTETVGAEDLIARLGGDEFAIIVQSATTETQLTGLANRVLDELRRPYVLAQVEVEISASIGIATAAGGPTDTPTLLRHADVAMYTAKEDQTGAQAYRPERDHYSPQRLALVAQLRSAIDHSELEMHYQPLIDLGTGELRGAEALVRWPTADGRMVMPDEFIHVAEHTGLIRALSRYVITEVIRQGSRWQRQGYPLRLSLNLSPRNLIEPDLPAELARLLRTYSLPPSALQLEMTETTVMSDPQRTIDVLNRFRATGVGIAIDDFGTGHSSLSYLTRLPATELKIDKSFVAAMSTDPASRTVVRSIIDLGRNLGLAVLAEGIETPEVAEDLRVMGCHLGQGYLYSRALPASDFRRWMDRHRLASVPVDDARIHTVTAR